MITPLQKQDVLVQSYFDRINSVVHLRLDDSARVPFEARKLSKEIEDSFADMNQYEYNLLLGMLSGVEYKHTKVHYFFSEAKKHNDSFITYVQYTKSLLNCSEPDAALEQAFVAYEKDDTAPEVYELIAEIFYLQGKLKTSYDWYVKYTGSVKHDSNKFEAIKKVLPVMSDINEDYLASYISAAHTFLKNRRVKVTGQTIENLSLDHSLIEVSVTTELSVDDSVDSYFDFVMSGYLSQVPDEILKCVSLRFVPHAS